MPDTSIFEISDVDVDLYNYVKIRTKAVLNDSIILKCLVFSNNAPVDLTNWNVEMRATLPKSGQVYSEADNIEKNGNELTIICDQILTSEIGEVISSLRIWNSTTKQKSSYQIVIKVLSTIISDESIATTSVLSAMQSLDLAINRYIELKTDLTTGITLAQTTIITLNNSITNAQSTQANLNTAVSDAVTTANTTITNVNASRISAEAVDTTLHNRIDEGNLLLTELGVITDGETLKQQLEAINSTGQATKAELIAQQDLANAKIIELQNFDPSNVVQDTNLIKNELYCDRELLTIHHGLGSMGLNGYPRMQMVYTIYGAGIGGAGDFPAGGGNSECNLMNNKTVYTDENNLTIYVPLNYYIAFPTIYKINDYKYVVCFDNSYRSILIQLREGI